MNFDDLEPVWRALANPVRRAILDALRDGPLTTGALAERCPELTRFAVMQHLGVLVEAELVIPRREGRKGVRGVGGTRNCDWWFTDEGILLDTAGRYTTEMEDREEWISFLDMVKSR